MSQLFASGGQIIGVSVTTLVLPMNTLVFSEVLQTTPWTEGIHIHLSPTPTWHIYLEGGGQDPM